MTTATMLYCYKKDEAKLYIHWPHFTESVSIEKGIDGEYAVFEDEAAVIEFMEYVSEHNIDVSEVKPCCFNGFEENAIAISDLI